MSDDVVAELNRWLDESAYVDTRERGREIERASMLIRAARVEIIALRRTIRLGPDLPALAREQALEEAARVCEGVPGDPKHGDFFASAIRALKQWPPN